MNIRLKGVALMGLLMLTGGQCAVASDSPVARQVDVAALPYEHVADLISEAGESKAAFLVRIGPQLRAYSNRTGYEACGMIATNAQGQFGVVVGSNHAHIGCVSTSERVPAGMTSTNETIHSHGRPGLRVLASPADWIFMGNPFDRPKYVGGYDLSHFSDQDYLNPGYLATPTGVIYQHGVGKVSTVVAAG